MSQPRLAGYIDMSFHVRNVHRSMLDQETGLRGWLATGDSTFLTPYTSGLEESETESDELLAELAAQGAPDLAEPVLEMLLARQVWEQWAMEAATRSFDATERDQLSDFLVVGKEHFDSYRVHVATSTDLIVS
ncbi:MAG: CHASE3 domain-containing protein, partial [Nocardioides sp.]